jgi:hypothetical protein
VHEQKHRERTPLRSFRLRFHTTFLMRSRVYKRKKTKLPEKIK